MLGRRDFVDRKDELAVLETSFNQAGRGFLRCVLLVGDPGTGKTRLANDFVAGHRQTAIGLAARGYPFGATTSFGLWIEALDRYVARLVAREVEAPPQLTPHQRLLVAITTILRELAAESPLIIVLDDIHLADASSWEALAYVARNLLESRILIVLCARAAELELDVRSTQVVLGLEQEGLLSRQRLAPLGYDHTAELIESRLGRPPSSMMTDWIFDRSRGNPFFVISLLQQVGEGSADQSTAMVSGVPAAVLDQVAGRLAALSPTERDALEVLSVVARPAELHWLATLTHRRSSSMAEDLDQLIARHLVAVGKDSADAAYEIVHPLIQEAIYAEAPPTRRQLIHRRVARSLFNRKRFAEAATHYARSASAGEAEAIDALIVALDESEQHGSPYEAMAILEALVTLLPSGDARWMRVLDAMVWDAEWILDYSAFVSTDVGLRAMREIERSLGDGGDPLRRAVVQLRLAGFSVWDVTQAESGQRACRQALEVFRRTGQDRLALIARYWLAWIAGISGSLPEMERWARGVIHDAGALGDSGMIMHAQGALGWALLRQGRFAEAERALRRATDLARRSGNLNRLAMDLSSLAYLQALRGQPAEAQALLNEAIATKPAAADDRLIAGINLLIGDARAAYDRLRDAARSTPGRHNSQHAWALVFATIAAARLGRDEEARELLEAARPYEGHVGLGWDSFCKWAEATVCHESGDLARALPLLRQAADEMWRSGYIPAAAITLADAAEVAAEAPDAPALVQIASQLEDIAKRLEVPLYAALAQLAVAQLQLLRLDAGAAQLADRAAVAFGRLGYRCWEARALEVKASALARSNRHSAVESLQRVIEITNEMGMVHRRQAALRGLDQMGRPGRRTARSVRGEAPISYRERQVVDLALRGLTASDIGRRLHISKRTVESHLANAYAKLGVQSRIELVQRANELEPSRPRHR